MFFQDVFKVSRLLTNIMVTLTGISSSTGKDKPRRGNRVEMSMNSSINGVTPWWNINIPVPEHWKEVYEQR